jgi:hypothetical protein
MEENAFTMLENAMNNASKSKLPLDEDKWMVVINSYWAMVTYREFLKLAQKYPLKQTFFHLVGLAFQNDLLTKICNVAELCADLAKNYDVGSDAVKVAEELGALCKPAGRMQPSQNCNVREFRDWAVCHPIRQQKELRGNKVKLSLEWATADKTINKIKEFIQTAENHMGRTGCLSFSTDGEVLNAEAVYLEVSLGLEDGAKYDALRRSIMIKGGRATVCLDWHSRDKDIVIGVEGKGTS